jgi:hypothetical protein
MASSASNPSGYSFNPMDAFSKPFSFVGLDTTTGSRNVDLYKSYLNALQQSTTTKQDGGVISEQPTTSTQSGGVISEQPTTSTQSQAVPDLTQPWEQVLKYRQASFPVDMAQAQASAELQRQLTQQQLADVYPWMSAAAKESAERGKEASLFKQGLPTTIQDIMGAKQAQLSNMAQADYFLRRGMAEQAQVAKLPAHLGYSGKSFSA